LEAVSKIAPGIPKGCEKVARGKRSAAPGMLTKDPRALKRARDLSRLTDIAGPASLQDAIFLRDATRGCASLAPGYLLASLRDAQNGIVGNSETVSKPCPYKVA